jgi:hypothetical protein
MVHFRMSSAISKWGFSLLPGDRNTPTVWAWHWCRDRHPTPKPEDLCYGDSSTVLRAEEVAAWMVRLAPNARGARHRAG